MMLTSFWLTARRDDGGVSGLRPIKGEAVRVMIESITLRCLFAVWLTSQLLSLRLLSLLLLRESSPSSSSSISMIALESLNT